MRVYDKILFVFIFITIFKCLVVASFAKNKLLFGYSISNHKISGQSQNTLRSAQGNLKQPQKIKIQEVFDTIEWPLFSLTSRKAVKKVCGQVVQPRIVHVMTGLDIMVFEAFRNQEKVQNWIDNDEETLDPFGSVVWPGAQLMARMLFEISALNNGLHGHHILELGAGTGLSSLVAASLGAAVIATDNNDETLNLLKLAAETQKLDSKIQTQVYDFCHSEDIISHQQFEFAGELWLIADCIYNDQAATCIAEKCFTAQKHNIQVLLLDSVNLARNQFIQKVTELGATYQFREVKMEVKGSAVLVDDDIQYTTTIGMFLF